MNDRVKKELSRSPQRTIQGVVTTMVSLDCEKRDQFRSSVSNRLNAKSLCAIVQFAIQQYIFIQRMRCGTFMQGTRVSKSYLKWFSGEITVGNPNVITTNEFCQQYAQSDVSMCESEVGSVHVRPLSKQQWGPTSTIWSWVV